MRIGIDAREAFRAEPRGIGLYTRHLLREFATAAPDDSFVLYHQAPAETGAVAPAPNQRAVRTDLPGDRFHLWERVCMPWRLRRDRLDLYHGTYNTLPPRWRAWPGPQLVVTLHDVIVTWWSDDLDDPYVRYARAITPRVVRDAAAILTVSAWSKRDICTRFDCPPGKVHVAHNGLHPAFEAGAPPGAADDARRRFADGRPYVFAVGAALERKNTGRLLEAWAIVRRQRPDWPHLLLVSGLARGGERLRARASAAGVAEHVRFLPYLAQHDLVAAYAGAVLSVYPSMVEGWGVPVCESLALGTPVVTSNTSGMPEAGGAFARYFDPADVESMASAILTAMEHDVPAFPPLRADAIAHARRHRWADTAQTVLRVYRDAAGRG